MHITCNIRCFDGACTQSPSGTPRRRKAAPARRALSRWLPRVALFPSTNCHVCPRRSLLLWYMIIYVEKMCAGDGGTHKHLWKHLNAESNTKTPINNN